MRDKDQVLMFNDSEIGLLKSVFSDNDDLLYIVRKVLLQFGLTKDEKATLKSAMSPELFRIIKKRIFPQWSDEFPLTQIPSIISGLTTDVRGRKIEDMEGLFEAKQLEIDYLEQQFAVLEGKKVDEKINLVQMGDLKGKDLKQCFIDITAYLWLLGHIDPMLVFIKNIAGQKKESVEEAKERMLRNSSK